jgi:NitT/TauT family transport system substrate-binding protein
MQNDKGGRASGATPRRRAGRLDGVGRAWRAGALGAMLSVLACAPGPAAAPAGAGAGPAGRAAAGAPAAAQPAPAAAPLRLVANWTAPTNAMTPLWVAQDNGIFREQGLDVELLNVPGTSQVIQTMVAGELQLSPLDPAATVQANLGGADILLLQSVHNRLPFSIVTQPTIRDPQGLRGTSIGVTRIGSSSHTAALVALRSWGLAPERDVAFRLLGTTPAIFAALEAGQVEAGVGTLPLPPQVRDGYTELINLATNGPEYPSVALGGPRAWIAANEEATRRFLRAYILAKERARADKAIALAAFRKYMQVDDPAILEDTYTTFLSMYEPLPYVSEPGFARVLEDLAADEPRVANYKVADFVDSKYVKEMETSGFLRQAAGAAR